MIFKVLPKVKLTWNDVFLGAFATALLFATGKFAIGFLGEAISASSYGAAASIILLVAWIYYSALILYFGAEFTRVYATEFGSFLDAKAETRECRCRIDGDRAGAEGDANGFPAHIQSEFQVTKADIIHVVATLSILMLLIFGRKRLRRVPLKLEKTF